MITCHNYSINDDNEWCVRFGRRQSQHLMKVQGKTAGNRT
jgi:hypothetical protein